MIITQPIITESRWPTMEFVGEWRGAGALQGLPRWMTIVNEDGTPTGPFLLCARKAFNLTTMSYRGWLFLGLVVDPVAVPDPDALLDALDGAYSELLAAADVTRRAGP